MNIVGKCILICHELTYFCTFQNCILGRICIIFQYKTYSGNVYNRDKQLIELS